MKQIIASLIVASSMLIQLAAAANIDSINGYSWSKMPVSEKAAVVLVLTQAIDEAGIDNGLNSRVQMSPEKAILLCIKTDQYYSSSTNLETPIINAWLNIARAI